MAGVFDINVESLDFTKIRMHTQSAAPASDTHASREARTKTDLQQCVRRHTLIAFAQQCRMYNIDALHAVSLQLAILLMSKCTDRKHLCTNFMSFVADSLDRIDIDDGATTMVDRNETHALQATSDWVALFGYVEVAQLSESQRAALRENQRVAVFVRATRHIFPDNAEIETIIVPMLSTMLMHIPAASMLERVLLAQGPQHRDIEVMCLRGVNAYVDECQHMSNDTTIQAISQLVRAIRVKAAFRTDVAAVMDAATDDADKGSIGAKRQFSLRRHIRDSQGAAVLHKAMLYEGWQHEMKFSVNISPATQRLLYWIRAQPFRVDASALRSLLDPQMLGKIFAISLERIDADAVCAVIRSLRVYQGNIESLLEFRLQCLVAFNAETRKKLTLPVVLQLYVACWQHPSIREQCWRSIINVSNFTITTGCEKFRSKYRYEQLSVLQTLLYCHTEHRAGLDGTIDTP
jgi:hypothetical protein